jgi:hypothetical protein
MESENHVLKQENLKLKKKCEEHDFIVNKLHEQEKEFLKCFISLVF